MAHERITARFLPIAACFIALFTSAAVLNAAEPTDVTAEFAAAALDIRNLTVVEFAGILVIRGEAGDAATALAIGRMAQERGYGRIANLVRVRNWSQMDAQITAAVRRELNTRPSLRGAQLQVRAQEGVVLIAGTVRHEMQRDAAVAVARRVDGVRGVQADVIVAD